MARFCLRLYKANDADWSESDHPRGERGRFRSNGGNSSSSKSEGIINSKPPTDSYGKPYKRPQYRLPKEEYAKVMSEINTKFDDMYSGKTQGWHITNPDKDSPAHVYIFEIHEFGEYNIFDKQLHEEGDGYDD